MATNSVEKFVNPIVTPEDPRWPELCKKMLDGNWGKSAFQNRPVSTQQVVEASKGADSAMETGHTHFSSMPDEADQTSKVWVNPITIYDEKIYEKRPAQPSPESETAAASSVLNTVSSKEDDSLSAQAEEDQTSKVLINPIVFYDGKIDEKRPVQPSPEPETAAMASTALSVEIAPNHQAPIVPVDLPIIVPKEDVEIVKERPSETKKNRITPYEVAEILMGKVSFRMVNNALYAFVHPVYAFLDVNAALRLIMRFCRNAAKDYGDGQVIRRVYDLIVMEPDIAQKRIEIPDCFLTFRDAVLDIRSGSTFQPSPKYFDTAFLNVFYVARATECPNFDRFLSTLSADNPLLVARVWETMGYLLTNDISAKSFFVMQGVRNSGKSKLGEFFLSLFDPDAVTSLDINTLGRQFGLADIIGKRLNASLDLPAGTLRNESVSMIKQLTGGDIMTADIKYMPRVKFQNRCKLLFATNHPILLEERDDAFFDRLVVIPFTVSIPREQCDRDLLKQFEPEKSAIVNKAITHYRQLKARNYVFSGDFSVNALFTVEARIPQNSTVFDGEEQVRNFVGQCCALVDETEGKTLTVDLFDRYQKFCGDSFCVLSLPQFSETLKKTFEGYVFPDRWRVNSPNPQRGFKGILLNSRADVSVCQ